MTLPVFDLCLKNGSVVLPNATVVTDVYVRDGRIARIGGQGDAGRVIDCTGLTILPGVIDTQVHFREPGLTGAEDLATGSMAAVMGGVTAVFEMPNTKPPTDRPEAVVDKLERARGRMWCDHAFYVGATTDNADRCGELEMLPGTAGIKIFMGSSTGSLLVSDDAVLERVLRSGRRRVAIHAEDEARLHERLSERRAGDPSSHPVWRDEETALRATQRIVRLARRTGRRIHVLHVTTPAELEFLSGHKDIASCEVTPQHLTLAGEEAYAELGTLAQMNPPIRGRKWRDGLWYWMGQGVPDIIGSDHAPHTLEAKQRSYPETPSGMPGVQTLLPLMLDHVAHGRLSLRRVVDMTSAGPQRLFGLVRKGRIAVGYDADFSVVDLAARWTVQQEWLASKCGWSPFVGRELTGRPIGTIIRGNVAMWEGQLAPTAQGEPLLFDATDRPQSADR